MNYYPHHIGDFNSATRHLTRVERSVYRDLMDLYYDTEHPIMKDMDKLCRLIIARSDEERTAVEQVLNEFFVETDDGWFHDRCEEELSSERRKRAALKDLQDREEYRKHRDFVLKRDGYACVYCGNSDAPLQLDHILPRSRGGSDDPENLAACCKSCNCSKGARTPDEWRCA